jgi:hypothetical protein
MAGKKTDEPSPERIARANRQRLAFEEGQKAMADVEKQSIAVRENMERLRTLRQAREAETLKTEMSAGAAKAKPKRKKRLSS